MILSRFVISTGDTNASVALETRVNELFFFLQLKMCYSLTVIIQLYAGTNHLLEKEMCIQRKKN